MAKKKKGGMDNSVSIPLYKSEHGIEEVNIGEYNKRGMLLFGANVQLARAIPDLRDGFKPVGRRVLYSIARIAKAHTKRMKVLSLRGFVIQIHPHGDSSIDDVIKDFSKPWELNYPLIEIKGNNGTPNGEPASASRYLEGKITDYCYDCYFKDWDNDIVELKDSYNPEYVEPEYLVSKFPDLLLRPATGFCFGRATYIPSFNLGEAFNAVIELIKDPTYEPVLVPDMPTSCAILDEGNFPEICKKGNGVFKMRAEIEIHEETNQLIVTSVPYNIDLRKVKEKINTLKDKELKALKKMFDGSKQSLGIDLELTFLPGTDLEVMRNILYKKTALESSFPTLLTYVDNYEIRVLSLKEIMESWIDLRRVIKRKSLIGKFVKGKGRIHVLDTLIDIIEDVKFCDDIIKSIRKSKRSEIVEKLHKKYNISTLQANMIAKMRIEEFSEDAYSEYVQERKDLKKLLAEIEPLMNSQKKMDKIIIKELEYAIEKYNRPRTCRVIKYDKEKANESFIPSGNYILIFTKNGFVKKIPVKNKGMGELNPGDIPVETLKIDNRDSVILFDDKGMIHTVAVNDIELSDKKSKGVLVSKYAHVAGQVVAVYPRSSIDDAGQFTFVTAKGMIKKTECSKYAFKSSIISILIKDDDKLVSVLYTRRNANIILYTKNGWGTRFNTKDITPTSRMSSGVIGMNLPEGDEVIGITKINPKDTHIMVLTEKGMGKCCTLDTFNTSSRRGEVLILTQLIPSDSVCMVSGADVNSNFMIISKNDTITLQMDQIPELTRNHYGKKLIAVPKGETIVKCIRIY